MPFAVNSGPPTYLQPGIGDAGSYQVSGIPYATASVATTTTVKEVVFPYVTSWVYIVQHTNDDLRVGFSANGVNDGYYFLLPGAGTNGQSATVTLPFKVTSLFFRCDDTAKTIPFTLCAGLTGIPTQDLQYSGPNGPNWSGSAGVG